MHSIALVSVTHVPIHIAHFRKHRLRIQILFVFNLFLALDPSYDLTNPGDLDRQAKMSVRVRKGGVKTP